MATRLSYQPTGISLAALKQDLEKNPIHASRVDVNLRQLNGKKDGAPVMAVSRAKMDMQLPETGIPTLDNTAQKAVSLTRFVPNSIKRSTGGILKGAIMGGLLALPVSAVLRRKALMTLIRDKSKRNAFTFFKEILATLAVMTGLAAGGGVLGFARSMWQNLRELTGIIFSGQR